MQVKQFKYLEKRAPLLADAVRHGEMTLEDARRKADGVTYTRVAVSVDGFLKSILRNLTPAECSELKEALSDAMSR